MRRRDLLKSLPALFASVEGVPLAQVGQQSVPQRRRVVPTEVIDQFKIRPAPPGYGLFVLGEDGQAYLLDDVLAAIFDMTKEHWQRKK